SADAPAEYPPVNFRRPPNNSRVISPVNIRRVKILGSRRRLLLLSRAAEGTDFLHECGCLPRPRKRPVEPYPPRMPTRRVQGWAAGGSLARTGEPAWSSLRRFDPVHDLRAREVLEAPGGD